MSVTLVIERSPAGQTGECRTFEAGELVVGRGDDADWQIEDPEMYVSRRHMVISLRDDRPHVTDMSRGGVFVDGGDVPLGAGNSRILEDGMRLRLGEVVIRVAAERDEATADRATPARRGGYEFEPAPPRPEAGPRPATLPDPFGLREEPAWRSRDEDRPPPRPLDPEDPFALDQPPARQPAADPPSRTTGGYFDADPEPAPELVPPAVEPAGATPLAWGPESARQETEPRPAESGDLRDAFLRGAGLDPARFPNDDPAAEMEEMGRRFRALVEGLMQLLRTRAQEKQRVRVAQTVISSADVNPLKFLATADDALGALVEPKGAGYLAPDAAIDAAFRDLADHQMRTWTALQSSLRRMIDQFDPAQIEAEMEKAGLIDTLLAGGRSGKLWRLYQGRYREIAKSAEDRFLGEIGAEFRDAYEGHRRTR